MVVAKYKVQEDENWVVILGLFLTKDKAMLGIQHTFLKVRGEPFLEGDAVVHQSERKFYSKFIDGCKFLDHIGAQAREGNLIDIYEQDEDSIDEKNDTLG